MVQWATGLLLKVPERTLEMLLWAFVDIRLVWVEGLWPESRWKTLSKTLAKVFPGARGKMKLAWALLGVVGTAGHPDWQRLVPSNWVDWLITQKTSKVAFNQSLKLVAPMESTVGNQAEVVKEEF